MTHTVQTAQDRVNEKGLGDFLTVKGITEAHSTVLLIDRDYGEYQVDLKQLSPKSNIPLHRRRRFDMRLSKIKEKYEGQTVQGLKIHEVFYGPYKGYKNRSFYLIYEGACGHTGVATYAALTRHKNSFLCASCSKVKHGVRTKEAGLLKKRTPTYNFWVKNKDKFPSKFKEFEPFIRAAGEKPYLKADIVFDDGRPLWIPLTLEHEEKELNLICTAIRQAFRHSIFYKEALRAARVETDEGARWRCKACGGLFKQKQIQVDHIDPVKPLDGTPLNTHNLIDRVWTKNIQILDKKCHAKKSTEENKLRKENKKNG